jgi:hypothetical protein
MSNSDDPVTLLEVTCKRETDQAILCIIDKREVWVPKSQVHDDSEVYAQGHEGKLVISAWFADKEGLVSDE